MYEDVSVLLRRREGRSRVADVDVGHGSLPGWLTGCAELTNWQPDWLTGSAQTENDSATYCLEERAQKLRTGG